MKILITGGDGQLAKSIAGFYPDENLVLVSKKDLDVTDRDGVFQKISEQKPDIVFHFASLTRGDECTKNPELAHKINVVGTENVVKAVKRLGIELVFVSTNEVFDGEKKDPYTEDDSPNPITVVGETKYDAEKKIRENLEKYYIIRTSWLFSKWSNNFLQAIFKKAKDKKRVELVVDEVSSPTYSIDLAKAIKELVDTGKYGIYNLANSGQASRLEFAKKAFELKGLSDVEINPLPLASFNRLSKPPLFTPLSIKKANGLGINIRDWESALAEFLSENNI